MARKSTKAKNVVRPSEAKKVSEPAKKKAVDLNEMYVEYVHGSSIQSIADKHKVSTQSVIKTIQEEESKR